VPRPSAFRDLRLFNGSTGNPCLFVDDQGRDNTLLIDCGDNAVLKGIGTFLLLDVEQGEFMTYRHCGDNAFGSVGRSIDAWDGSRVSLGNATTY